MGLRRSWITAFRVSTAAGSSFINNCHWANDHGFHQNSRPQHTIETRNRSTSTASWYSSGSLWGKPNVVACEGMNFPVLMSRVSQRPRPHHRPSALLYDFIIIGYGHAGKSALKTARLLCPNARIGVIDPFIVGDEEQSGVEFWRTRSLSLSPCHQEVLVEADGGGKDDDDDDGEDVTLCYKYGVLVATGAHGAPPPHYLVDDEAKDRVLELHSTILSTPASRPIYGSSQVTRHVLSNVTDQSATVAVLGSGWEAIELVARTMSASKRKNRPVLIMGASGPLSHILPNYLSTALTKRLRSKGVTVCDRSLVRYIAHQQKNSRLQIYTAKSYDFLDGNTTVADHVVVAPNTHGSQGSAALPSHDIPDHLLESAHSRSWYHTWSHLTTTLSDDDDDDNSNSLLLSCYQDDGRIVVNQELCAATHVYAAGSVAKAPNTYTGHASVAGGGYDAATESGRVAATNMVQLYYHSSNNSSSNLLSPFGRTNTNAGASNKNSVVTQHPIRVYRSDRVMGVDDDAFPHGLGKVGVQALCVGSCDPELATHAVWWTNQAAQRRLLSLGSDEDSRRETKRTSKNVKPVYGMGVVFYVDRIGRIQGVMTWGLPYTTSATRGDLNAHLVQQLEDVIRNNGGFREVANEVDQIRMTRYMEETSKQLVVTALNHTSRHDTTTVHKLPRPLHRYTDARHTNIRNTGFLKRKDGQGYGVNGENLFARIDTAADDQLLTDPDVPRPLNTNNEKLQALYEWTVWEQRESQWEENEQRARPTKEDPLWIRKGDEQRNVPQRERIAAAYSALLRQSGDG